MFRCFCFSPFFIFTCTCVQIPCHLRACVSVLQGLEWEDSLGTCLGGALEEGAGTTVAPLTMGGTSEEVGVGGAHHHEAAGLLEDHTPPVVSATQHTHYPFTLRTAREINICI